MSTKLTAFMVGVVGLFAVAIGTMQGCGGSSGGGTSNAALCNKVCDKAVACTPGATAMDKTTCVMTCNSSTMGMVCSNQAAIASAVNNCVAMADCNAADACLSTVPDCQQTSGTAGTSGGSGTAGTSGGTTWSCDDDTVNMACACAQGIGGTLTACPSTYNCCATFSASGTPACGCTTLPAAQCPAFAQALPSGSQVSHCPP
jgi:hypothetical protein